MFRIRLTLLQGYGHPALMSITIAGVNKLSCRHLVPVLRTRRSAWVVNLPAVGAWLEINHIIAVNRQFTARAIKRRPAATIATASAVNGRLSVWRRQPAVKLPQEL